MNAQTVLPLGMLTLLASVLAGCIGGPGGGAAVGAVAPTAIPQFDDRTGAIVGQVTTDEQVPLVGADVGVVAAGLTTRTDRNGNFAINHVAPGEALVSVAMVGYLPAQQRVTVEAGKATEPLAFALTRVAVDGPFHKTVMRRVELTGVMWKLTPSCIYEPLTTINPLLKTCGGIREACPGDPDPCEGHTSETDFKGFNRSWQSIVGEVRWTPQTGATGKGFFFDLDAPNITRGTNGAVNQADPHTFAASSNKSPIMVRVDKDGLAKKGVPEKDWNNYNSTEARCASDSTYNCDWFYRLFPAAYDAGIGEDGFGPDYGISYQNVAEIYVSYFINERAPPGFTALPL